MIHFTTSDRVVGTLSSIYVTLKMTVFAGFVYHAGVVIWDAGLAGLAGLLVMHYGKKVLPIFDSFMKKMFRRIFK